MNTQTTMLVHIILRIKSILSRKIKHAYVRHTVTFLVQMFELYEFILW